MGRVSPGMAGGSALIWSRSSSRARATRGAAGCWGCWYPVGVQTCALPISVRGDLVGDGAGVAGHGGRVGVDLVEEQFQGAGDAGRGGLLEGDGDRGGGEGDGAGQAADDGLAGDGAVFVVVTQVVVELA